MALARLAIDTGYETSAVYAWSRQVGFSQVAPVKGVEGFTRTSPVTGPTYVDATVAGKRLRRGARLWTVATSTFKAETYRFLRQDRPTREEQAAGALCPPGTIHLPDWADGEWLDGGSEAGVKLKLDITPDLVAAMAAEVKAGEKAVTAAMREAGTGLKTAWRGQITGAGLGRRLANSIRSQTYPKAGESLNAAALVWSKAPVIVGAHDTGPLIRSKDGFWLAIPLPAAGKSLRGGRITPGEWERRRGLRLRFVYRRTGPSLLVAEGRLNTKGQAVVSRSKTGRGKVTAPIFLLVPQVKLPKRLDLARDADRALESVPGLIVANWVEVRL